MIDYFLEESKCGTFSLAVQLCILILNAITNTEQRNEIFKKRMKLQWVMLFYQNTNFVKPNLKKMIN